MILLGAASVLLLAFLAAVRFLGFPKVREFLAIVWTWLRVNFTYENWFRIFLGAGASMVFLVGLLTAHRIGDALPLLGDALPKALADIDLSSYLNLAFWGKVARWDGSVLVISILAMIWTRGRTPSQPQPPAVDPNAPKGA